MTIRQNEWSTPSEYGMIKYTNISPGEYKLKIRAILLDNNQLLEERDISIIIKRPLWLTTWALILYLIIIISAAYSLYMGTYTIFNHNYKCGVFSIQI